MLKQFINQVQKRKLSKFHKAIFLDRDGIVNEVIMQNGQPSSPENFGELKLKKGIKTFLDHTRRLGFLNIIFTNQPDVARSIIPIKELNKMHRFIKKTLAINDIYFCPHDDHHNCECRKPKPGMLLQAIAKWNIDSKKSYTIGDRWKDIEAGKTIGSKTILWETQYNQSANNADFKVDSFLKTLRIIKNHL